MEHFRWLLLNIKFAAATLPYLPTESFSLRVIPKRRVDFEELFRNWFSGSNDNVITNKLPKETKPGPTPIRHISNEHLTHLCEIQKQKHSFVSN